MNLLDGWRPDAVVFDCDGLLMDTESCWTIAERALFARHGLGFSDADKATLIGRSIPDAAAVLARTFRRPGENAAIAQEMIAAATQTIAANAEPMPGARELLARLRGRLPLGVASNATRALLDVALRRGGFTQEFSVSLSAEDVRSPKPAPDLYREACRGLGVAAGRALAFEDSLTGLRSAQVAGLKCVGIPTLHQGEFPADLVFTSLADPQLLAWVDRWFAE
jgi:HAD superfamily hydrolase (TIGR01509 family)